MTESDEDITIDVVTVASRNPHGHQVGTSRENRKSAKDIRGIWKSTLNYDV